MPFKKRQDGLYLKKLPAFRRIFPYLMRTRTESLVYFSDKIDMTPVVKYLDRVNTGKTKVDKITIFQIFLAAIIRTLKIRPELNRFIAGRRIYEHKGISLSFTVKKEFSDAGGETNVQMTFEGSESLAAIREKLNRHITRARSGAREHADKLLEFFIALPRPLLSLATWLIRFLDYHNILPAFLRKAIPFFTSVFIANLGSIGLDAPYHHLYEYGTASLFLVIGKMHKEAMVTPGDQVEARNCINLSLTMDERITDGFYGARSLLLFRKLLACPGKE